MASLNLKLRKIRTSRWEIYQPQQVMNSRLILCFLVRASSYIPIRRPTDATCDRSLFSIYMCITLHVLSVKRSSSGVPHRTYSLQFLCLCLSVALSCKKLLQDSAADRHKHLLVYLLESRLITFLAFGLVNENLWWFSINKDSKQNTDKWQPCECVFPPFRHRKHED
jgi:hypothetical protein